MWPFKKQKTEKRSSELNFKGTKTISLAGEQQYIDGVMQLPLNQIDDMVERKHNLEFQLSLCDSIMIDGGILPFPFERAIILLCKAKRFKEALQICLYIKDHSEKAEKGWDGKSAKIWMSPKLQKCVKRIPKLLTQV